MSITNLLTRYTYDDYCLWEGDWELIEGFPVAMAPAPMRIHQNLLTEIVFILKKNLENLECKECEVTIETDWKINENTVLRPDIVFTCNDHHEKYLTKAPKIIFEIISPATAKNDEKIKFSIYENEKVEYYILIYPTDLKAKVYKLKDDKYSKVGDFTNEKLKFKDIECDLEVDFDKVFKRFKNQINSITSPKEQT